MISSAKQQAVVEHLLQGTSITRTSIILNLPFFFGTLVRNCSWDEGQGPGQLTP